MSRYFLFILFKVQSSLWVEVQRLNEVRDELIDDHNQQQQSKGLATGPSGVVGRRSTATSYFPSRGEWAEAAGVSVGRLDTVSQQSVLLVFKIELLSLLLTLL
jgi:hypothetical protein